MNSEVPTGDNIFAEETSATMDEARGVAHFATSVAKRAGPGDTKTRWKISIQLEPLKPRGTTDARTRRKPEPPIKNPGKADAKTKKKIVVTPAKRVGPGDAKTRKKPPPPPLKISGTRDAKTKRKAMLHKEPGRLDAKGKGRLVA